jgi:hypothetical protein
VSQSCKQYRCLPTGSSEENPTGKPSISGHPKLIADFINAIDPSRTWPL